MADLKPYQERNVERLMGRCIHFNGIQNDACKVGVSYDSVWDGPKPPRRLPCFKADANSHLGGGLIECPKAEFMAREQAIADDAESAATVAAYFEAIKAGNCPNHKRPVTLRQVGHCVYGDCGCRMYQGKLPSKAEPPARRGR